MKATISLKVHDLLIRTAETFPDRIAAIYDGRRMSFRQLDHASDRFAKHLRDLNLPPNSRVAILFDNCLEYLPVFFGVFKAGLIAVPMDTSLRADALAQVLADSEARVLVVQGKFRRKLADLLKDNRQIASVIADTSVPTGRDDLRPLLLNTIIGEPDDWSAGHTVGSQQEFVADSPLDMTDAGGTACPHELAAMFYTSGSTGSCK